MNTNARLFACLFVTNFLQPTEVQTPQCIKPELLQRGFDKVKAEDLEVTDDVSIIEQLGEPVRITTGDYYNIKLTTPEDLQLAESVLSS